MLIPRLGAIGASLVTTVFAGLGALAAVLAVYRIWRVLPPLATLLRSVLICGVGYALGAFWPAPGFWLLVKLPAIGVVIALAFLSLGEFSAGEIALTRSMLRWRTVAVGNPQNPSEV